MKKLFKKIVGKPKMIDGDATLYRIMALFGTIIALIQCIIWGLLSILSLIYYGIGASHGGKNEHLMSAYGYVFTSTYFMTNSTPFTNAVGNVTEICSNVSSNGLFIITIIYFVLTLHLALASVLLLLATNQWLNGKIIRCRVTHWIIAVFIMSGWEFSTGLILFLDFLVCSDQEQHNVAAAAITLSVLFFKGFVLVALNVSISICLFCIQYCGYSKCPV